MQSKQPAGYCMRLRHLFCRNPVPADSAPHNTGKRPRRRRSWFFGRASWSKSGSAFFTKKKKNGGRTTGFLHHSLDFNERHHRHLVHSDACGLLRDRSEIRQEQGMEAGAHHLILRRPIPGMRCDRLRPRTGETLGERALQPLASTLPRGSVREFSHSAR